MSDQTSNTLPSIFPRHSWPHKSCRSSVCLRATRHGMHYHQQGFVSCLASQVAARSRAFTLCKRCGSEHPCSARKLGPQPSPLKLARLPTSCQLRCAPALHAARRRRRTNKPHAARRRCTNKTACVVYRQVACRPSLSSLTVEAIPGNLIQHVTLSSSLAPADWQAISQGVHQEAESRCRTC